jgi:thiol-disulfide isomerase/thioredoxin
MKIRKTLYIIALGIYLSAASVQAQSLHYHIIGKLNNISPVPAKMYLSELIPVGMITQAVDSALVQNGSYDFSGELDADEAIAVVISPQLKSKSDDQIIFILDKGELQVTSEGQINKFKVAGSGALANQQFDDMKGDAKKTTDSIKAVMAGDGYKADKELQAKTTKRMYQAAGQAILHMYTYIKAYPENRISPFGTLTMVSIPWLSQAGKDTLVSLLTEKVKEDKLGRQIVMQNNKNKTTLDSAAKASQARALENQSKIPLGSKAIEIKANDPNGEAVSLTSLKGKYVLVDFWASWCAPCRAENPNVVKLYQQYKDKGFTVFGVSLDGSATKAAWVKAIDHDGLAWTQVSDLKGWGSGAAKDYGVQSIPQNFLLDPNGVVIAKNLRGDDLAKKLASIFNK